MSNHTNTGWSNTQTWNINLMYGEMFANMVEEQTFDDVEHLADAMQQIVSELELDGIHPSKLARHAVEVYLSQVDWQELAGHFYEEEVLREDEAIKGLRELLAEADI